MPAAIMLSMLALPGASRGGQPCPNCGPVTTRPWTFPERDHDGTRSVLVRSVLVRPARPRPLDSLQQAVVESLLAERRTTASEFLDAAIRAADVEADAAALSWFQRVLDAVADAGDDRPTLLADLGDFADQAALLRLARRLRPLDADSPQLIDAMREAARQRRRDPARLAQAAADLASVSAPVRQAAVDELARARIDSLPSLVDLLQSTSPEKRVARVLARELISDMGTDARQPLLAWLGSGDVDHWQGVIAALEATGSSDVADFFLAPALVPGTPPGVQRAGLAALTRHTARLTGEPDHTIQPPTGGVAISIVATRLDCILSPQGMPHVPLHPTEGPPTVSRWRWNQQALRLEPVEVSARLARSIDAAHLARDLQALDARDPLAVRLVTLTRVESLLLSAGEAETALERIPAARLAEAFTGPDGLDPGAVTDVLEEALDREMTEVAVAAVELIEAMHTAAPDQAAAAALPPATRKTLVKLVDAPNETLALAAARALALTGGDGLAKGNSRMVERLLRAATARGVDRAVVAHPDLAVANTLAADASRHGYRTTVVASGHEALRAAASSVDTNLVLLGARIAHPGAFETLQGLRQPGRGELPPVMIVVDPLDDLGRGRKLSTLILQARAHSCVGIVDRLPSFFEPTFDAAGTLLAPPRFPEELATISQAESANPAWRQARAWQRMERGRQALEILALLGHQGFDLSAGEENARLAITTPSLLPAALKLLAVVGRPGAQATLVGQALTEVDPQIRALALAALRENVERFGMLLAQQEIDELCRGYNAGSDAGLRETAATILGFLPKRASPAIGPPRPGFAPPSPVVHPAGFTRPRPSPKAPSVDAAALQPTR